MFFKYTTMIKHPQRLPVLVQKVLFRQLPIRFLVAGVLLSLHFLVIHTISGGTHPETKFSVFKASKSQILCGIDLDLLSPFQF